METRTIDYQQALLECQRIYRKAAIYETFLTLNLRNSLQKALTVEEIADPLNLNHDALSRFLHAAASLGLVEKHDNTFVARKNHPHYSNQSSLVLFWLFNIQLPDLLKAKPASLAEIKEALPNCDKTMLALAVQFHLLIQDEEGAYAIPRETRKYLLSDSPAYIGPRIKHFEKIMFPMFSVKGLLGALRSGKSQWGAFFNNDVSHPFDLYKNDPVLLETFTHGLHQLNAEDDKTIAEKIPISSPQKVLDVGGGSGAFVLKLLKQFPTVKEVDIYELPDAIPLMQKIFKSYAPEETRVRFVGGSFLKETHDHHLNGLEPKDQYDLIILGWILHDWTDATNLDILKRIMTHLKPGKTLLILESILPENKIGPACLGDMAMLLQTEGRERTLSEYKNLLFSAGYDNISTIKTDTQRQPIMATRPLSLRSRL